MQNRQNKPKLAKNGQAKRNHHRRQQSRHRNMVAALCWNPKLAEKDLKHVFWPLGVFFDTLWVFLISTGKFQEIRRLLGGAVKSMLFQILIRDKNLSSFFILW